MHIRHIRQHSHRQPALAQTGDRPEPDAVEYIVMIETPGNFQLIVMLLQHLDNALGFTQIKDRALDLHRFRTRTAVGIQQSDFIGIDLNPMLDQRRRWTTQRKIGVIGQ